MSAGTSPDFKSPPGERNPHQFRLWELLLFMAAASGFMFLSAPLVRSTGSPILVECIGLVLFALTWWAIRTHKWGEAVVVVCISLTLMALLLPAVQYDHHHRRGTSCTHNLRKIGQALTQYEATYGSFPPAYIADATGKPMHSWRVLILPFLEQETIYKRYDFSEPWDGPNNIKLAPLLNSLYGCDSDSRTGVTSQTSYVAVIGPTTMWPGPQSARHVDAQDGSSNVILVVEVNNSGIQTTEPRDLDISQMPMAISPQSGLGISSGHGNGASVLFLDGSVKWLDNTVSPATIRKLLIVDDGSPKMGEY